MRDLYLYRNALRDLLRPRRVATAAVLASVPSVLAGILRLVLSRRETFPGESVFNVAAMMLIYGFVLVILSVIFGTGVISQEVEQKTIPYLLTRPMPRWRIALAKLLAAATTITATVWVALLLLALVTLGPAGLAPAHIGRDLWVLPFGALAYGSVFLLVATLLNRPLLWGLGYTFGWEALVGNLPGDAQRFSIMTYLRVLSPHPMPEGDSINAARLLAAFFPQSISPTFAGRVLLGTIVVALVLALYCFSTREYVPREDTD